MKQYGGVDPPGLINLAKRTAKPFVRRAIHAANRRLGRFENRIWLIGEGRSGTTWFAEMLNADQRMLKRFEPFHPDYNARVQHYPKLLYRRPGTQDAALQAVLEQTFRAEYWDKWVDQHQRGWVFDGILVKDVFASLLARWAIDCLPPIKPVLLVRNPFAVARSKVTKVGWDWADDISALLADQALVEDHLAPFVPLLRGVAARGEMFLNHIAIWAVVHYVLLRQFARHELHLAFYEDAIADHARVRAEASRYLGRPQPDPAIATLWDEASSSRVSVPEQVARVRSDPYGSWKLELDAATLHDGLAILEAFGLHLVYDEAGRPDPRRMRFKDDPA